MSNMSKAWIFLLGLATTLIIVGQSAWGRQGLLWALVISLALNALIYLLGDSRLSHLFPGKRLEGHDPWQVQEITLELCRKARIPTPKIVLLSTQSPQAFAIGHSWRHSTIFLTQGLLKRLNATHLRAVIAYQIACIKRQDTFIFSIASFFANLALTVTGLLDAIFRLIIGAKRSSHSLQSQLFTSLFAPFVSLILKLSIPKSSYFDIDFMAASWLTQPKDLADALWNLDSYTKTIPMDVPASASHIFIVSPLCKKNWMRHFISQPSTKQRIIKLIGYYPI